ncbi:MAG: ATP-binding cassette domain-containing protein [Flavobacteriales bacterium]
MSGLHIDSVRKSYNHKVILSDVFISCHKGEIKGLIGRNGSGKSTLLKIVFGTEKAESKFVRVGEKIIRNISDGRNLINYLPQDNFLPNDVKIKTLINLFLPKESRELLFQNKHIQPVLNKKNQNLSSGEKRIVEILIIIHSNAEYILLDEPFNGVSPILRDYIIEYIKKIKSSKGFIITDHDYENVIGLADSIVHLQNGFLKEINDKSELVELGYLTKTMFANVYKI